MAKSNAYDVMYELMEIEGHICLFTDNRIDKTSIPDGLFYYDVRHDDGGDMCTIEKNVVVNYYGGLISKTELLPDGAEYINIEDIEYGYVGDTQSLKEFASQKPQIVLCVNNQRRIQLLQEETDGNTKVKTFDSNGDLESYYEISPGDFTMILNYYRVHNENGKEMM